MKQIYKPVEEYLKRAEGFSPKGERLITCQSIIEGLAQAKSQSSIKVSFICTHNSRRSQFSQVWAQVICAYLGIDNIQIYSAGTEVTQVYDSVIKTFENTGLIVHRESSVRNSKIQIGYSDSFPTIDLYSKKISDLQGTDFYAIMTCDHASQNCPIIPNAAGRFELNYQDPKRYDQSSEELIEYEKTSMMIMKELYYIFSKLNNE